MPNWVHDFTAVKIFLIFSILKNIKFTMYNKYCVHFKQNVLPYNKVGPCFIFHFFFVFWNYLHFPRKAHFYASIM